MNLTVFHYQGSPIQFEEVDGKIMANATLMAKAFGKEPGNIFRTKSWIDYEKALCEEKGLRSADLQTVRNGDNGGSWIHQELAIEFARRLNPRFSIWCNDRIAELLRTGKTEIKQIDKLEILLQACQSLVNHERRLNTVEEDISGVKEDVKVLKAQSITHPEDYFTAAGYACLLGRSIDRVAAIKIGKTASAICKERNCKVGKVSDEKYGEVNTYPKEVLSEVFKQYYGK